MKNECEHCGDPATGKLCQQCRLEKAASKLLAALKRCVDGRDCVHIVYPGGGCSCWVCQALSAIAEVESVEGCDEGEFAKQSSASLEKLGGGE